MGGGPLDRGKVVLRDGAYSCETLTMVLGGIGVVAGGAAGFFVGGLVHPTRYTPHRYRRFVLGGAFVGIMSAMAHLTFADPACLPHNRGLGR